MSDHRPPQTTTPPRPRRHIVISIIMVLFGIILLLPGVCALIFVAAGVPKADSSLVLLWAFCFVVSAGGITLIVKTFR